MDYYFTEKQVQQVKPQDNNDSFTPSMFPDMRISLSVQTKFVNILLKYYKLKSIRNCTLDTLIKPFTNFVKLTESEKNTLINKTVKYFQILYTTYMNNDKGHSVRTRQNLEEAEGSIEPGSKTIKKKISDVEIARRKLEGGEKRAQRASEKAEKAKEEEKEFEYHDYAHWAELNH